MRDSTDRPDTPLCAAALAYAVAASEPFLLNHTLRSFVFADAIGRASNTAYDRELLYVACVLHDLGLTAGASAATRFEVEGADAARAFLADQGVGARDQDLVWDAIALHTTAVIPQRKCAEIALCQLGTAVDIGFAPRSLVAADVIASALASFPRRGFKRAMVGALCGLALRNPQAGALSSPVADVADRHLPGFSRPQFCDVIASAEFDE
jgi:hypothetical protein